MRLFYSNLLAEILVNNNHNQQRLAILFAFLPQRFDYTKNLSIKNEGWARENVTWQWWRCLKVQRTPRVTAVPSRLEGDGEFNLRPFN